MKFPPYGITLLLWILLCSLAGCATRGGGKAPSAPSVGGVVAAVDTAADRNTAALGMATAARSRGISARSPEAAQLEAAVKDTQTALATARAETLALQIRLQEHSLRVAELEVRLVADADRWKKKQRAALTELWIWRGACLAAVLWLLRKPLIGGLGFVVRKFAGVPW
jgi:septal ring factor EnvC (AmiA/AmiB activator)